MILSKEPRLYELTVYIYSGGNIYKPPISLCLGRYENLKIINKIVTAMQDTDVNKNDYLMFETKEVLINEFSKRKVVRSGENCSYGNS